MRRHLLLGSLAVVLVAASALPASAARRPSCVTAGTTLAASTALRVYRVGAPDDRTIASCWLRTARRTTLGTSLELGENSQELDSLGVAGRFVAYRQAISTGEDLTVDVLLVDARSGRRVRAPVDVAAAEAETSTAVDAVLPTAGGAAVWSGRASDCEGLHVLRAAGSSTLACGRVTEVAVAGARVYWQQDGQTRTAVLPAG